MGLAFRVCTGYPFLCVPEVLNWIFGRRFMMFRFLICCVALYTWTRRQGQECLSAFVFSSCLCGRPPRATAWSLQRVLSLRRLCKSVFCLVVSSAFAVSIAHVYIWYE